MPLPSAWGASRPRSCGSMPRGAGSPASRGRTPRGVPGEGGWVSASFGLRADPFTGHQSMHEGMDIASRLGSSILAMGDGVITWAADKVGYGLDRKSVV